MAQQPFITDDTDVTPRHKFHFEFSNEFDVLPRASFPNLKQNTADAELDYGLFRNFEVGIEAPVLTIVNDRSAPFRRPSGLGDVNLSFKYNYLNEHEGSWRPALAVTFNLELPTGDVNRQLGSGLADFYVNNVLQKSLTKNTKLRLNGGLLFSGNETTGVIGLKSRGLVLTGAASLVKQFTPKLDLGVEVTGAVTRNLQLGKGQLQTMFGGNYALSKKMTFDFGIVGGRYAASPRLGVQLGVSVDF
ncbi:MAG TPA: transporter [Pyrinomonadaceae bacterium]|nr:transporter [Pyrinomonadaceae bacterium]